MTDERRLPTPRRLYEIDQNHRLEAFCKDCGVNRMLDLEALATGRWADTAVIHLPLRCANCGSKRVGVTLSYSDPRFRNDQ